MSTFHQLTSNEVKTCIQNMRLEMMAQKDKLAFIIKWLFKEQDCLPSGPTKKAVDRMTKVQQIELLEQIGKEPSLLGNTAINVCEIWCFTATVNKGGFAEEDRRKQSETTGWMRMGRKWLYQYDSNGFTGVHKPA